MKTIKRIQETGGGAIVAAFGLLPLAVVVIAEIMGAWN